MEQSTLNLNSQKHPHKDYFHRFDQLLGLDDQKAQLLQSLKLIFDEKGAEKWLKRHHSKGLGFLSAGLRPSPLILLSGEVGCGKTELAQTIGSPLARSLGGETVLTFETPSDIRGIGHVGELSARIKATFESARNKLRGKEVGILIVDEADDLATSRGQVQAHHEDRAGVDVLIKEIDRIERDKVPLAVILITNRADALDPAILRRATTQLIFSRPNREVLSELIARTFEGVGLSSKDVETITQACQSKPIAFTYSDILKRLTHACLIEGLVSDSAISLKMILEKVKAMSPSPIIEEL